MNKNQEELTELLWKSKGSISIPLGLIKIFADDIISAGYVKLEDVVLDKEKI